VGQAAGSIKEDTQPVVPGEALLPTVTLVKPLEHVPAREKLIHEEALQAMLTPPEECYQMWVPELAQKRDFVFKACILRAFSLAHQDTKVNCLDGHI